MVEIVSVVAIALFGCVGGHAAPTAKASPGKSAVAAKPSRTSNVRSPSQLADSGITVRARQEYYGFNIEHAVSYTPAGIMIAKDSNFMCPVRVEAWLGRFVKTASESSNADQALVVQIQKRLPKKVRRLKRLESPHNAHFFIDEADVSYDEDNSRTVVDILTQTCDDPDVQPVAAAQVRIEKKSEGVYLTITEYADGKKTDTTVKAIEYVDCHPGERDERMIDCMIPGYGLATLAKPKARR